MHGRGNLDFNRSGGLDRGIEATNGVGVAKHWRIAFGVVSLHGNQRTNMACKQEVDPG
jgi:hypothetical protein